MPPTYNVYSSDTSGNQIHTNSSNHWVQIKPECESFDSTNTAWSTSSTTSPPTPRAVADGGSTGTDDCNESLKHSNAQKAVFHAVKGAKRLVDEQQHQEALSIAGNAGKAFLSTEGKDFDEDRSESHLMDRVVDEDRSDEENIKDGIDMAFDKIDSGNHIGGARVAIAVANEYYAPFEPL